MTQIQSLMVIAYLVMIWFSTWKISERLDKIIELLEELLNEHTYMDKN